MTIKVRSGARERPGVTMAARVVLVLACALLVHSLSRADALADWNKIALDTVGRSDESLQSKLRAIATVHVAMFEAVNFAQGRYAPHFTVGSPMLTGMPIEAVAAGAAHRVLADLYPNQAPALAAALKSSLLALPGRTDTAVITGNSIGGAIRALRPSELEPWLLRSSGRFRTTSPIPLQGPLLPGGDSDANALSIRVSAVRSDGHVDHPWVSPLSWNPMVAELIAIKGLSPIETARIHALVSMVIADAHLVAQDTRYPCAPCVAAAAVAAILESELGGRGHESNATDTHQEMGRGIGRYALRHYYLERRAQAR